MAYDANKHAAFSDRCRDWVRNMKQAYVEAGDLDDIYINESSSGGDAAFTDTDNATEAEHVDAIILMRRLRDCLAMDGQSSAIASEDQTARITPWLQ